MFKGNLGIKIAFLIILFFTTCGFAQTKNKNIIKVALLDTPYNEMPLNLSLISEYQKAYLSGIETAAHVARKYNIEIIYKPFFYGEGSLDILDETPKIQDWQADLVIGPSSSDQFTLLRNALPNVMVLSSYASGKTLQTLPKNFYSIFLPDNQIMTLLAEHIHKKFPTKNIYIIVQADCKQCVDVSKLFTTSFNKASPSRKITETKVILDHINSIDSKKLMLGHENDVTLIFNLTYYAYNELVKRIAQSFPNKNLIFFSDQDNWGGEANHNAKTTNTWTYESYRIGPLLADNSLPDYKNFSKAYFSIYQSKPKDGVAYMTYITVMSAIEALNKFPTKNENKSIREKILNSYVEAIKKNSNWFRINNYGVYELTPQGEVLAEKLPLPN